MRRRTRIVVAAAVAVLAVTSCGESVSPREPAADLERGDRAERVFATVAGDDAFLVVAEAGFGTVAGVVSARTGWTETLVSPIVSGADEPPSGTWIPGGGWALVANGCPGGDGTCADLTRELYTSRDPQGPLAPLTALDGLRGGELFIAGATEDEVVLVHHEGRSATLHAVDLDDAAVRELAWHPDSSDEQGLRDRSDRAGNDVIHDVARTAYCVAGDLLWAVTSPELAGVPIDPAARTAAPQDVQVIDIGSGEVLDRFATTAVESRGSGIDCTEDALSVAAISGVEWVRAELDRSGAVIDEHSSTLDRDPDDGIVAGEWTGDGYAYLSAPPATAESYTTASIDPGTGVGSAPPLPVGTAHGIDRTGTVHLAGEDVPHLARVAWSRSQRTFLIAGAGEIRVVELSR